MSLISDPISGVLGVFFKRAMDSKIAQRLTLLLEMFIASLISFLVPCGWELCVMKRPVPIAIGWGMMMAGVAILGTFLGSPNAKGLYVSIPQDVMKQEMETQMSNIQRSDK